MSDLPDWTTGVAGLPTLPEWWAANTLNGPFTAGQRIIHWTDNALPAGASAIVLGMQFKWSTNPHVATGDQVLHAYDNGLDSGPGDTFPAETNGADFYDVAGAQLPSGTVSYTGWQATFPYFFVGIAGEVATYEMDGYIVTAPADLASITWKVFFVFDSPPRGHEPLNVQVHGGVLAISTSSFSVTQGTNPWNTADAADATPASAVPAKAIYVAGTDGTNARGLLLDSSGRIVLGAPSANLPVNVQNTPAVSQSGSPWGTADAADATPASAVPAKAIYVAGTDGTNARGLLLDSSGRLILGAPSSNLPVSIAAQSLSPIVVSDSTDGTPGSASPSKAGYVAGTDGTNLQGLRLDTTGRIILGAPSANLPVSIAAQSLSPIVTGDAADATTGSAPPSKAIYVAGTDGTNAQGLRTDTTGRIVLGAPSANLPVNLAASAITLNVADAADATTGAAPPSKAIYVAGTDGTNAQGLRTDTTGRQVAVGAGASGAALSGNPLLVAGSDGTNARNLSTDSSGRLVLGAPSANLPVSIAAQSLSPIVTGDAADATLGSAPPAKAIYVAGTDGTNARGLSTDSSGRLVLPPATTSRNLSCSAGNSTGNTLNVGAGTVIRGITYTYVGTPTGAGDFVLTDSGDASSSLLDIRMLAVAMNVAGQVAIPPGGYTMVGANLKITGSAAGGTGTLNLNIFY